MRSNIVVFALVVAACAGGDDDHAAADGPQHTELHVVASIGGIDELRPEYEFGRVTGLTLLGDGRVAVADGLNDVVRVFEPEGTHAFSFGRRGAGPGEFSGLCCLARGPDDALWVRDGGNGRYSAFDVGDSARYRSVLRMAHSDANRHAPLTFDAEARLIDIGMRAHPVTGQHRPHRLHLDSAGNVTAAVPIHGVPDDSTSIKTVQRQVEGGTATLYAYQPFGPTELAAHAPTGEFAHALSSRYAIDWRAADGSLIRHIAGTPGEGPPLSADERARGEEQIAATLQRLGVGRMQLGFDLPPARPRCARSSSTSTAGSGSSCTCPRERLVARTSMHAAAASNKPCRGPPLSASASASFGTTSPGAFTMIPSALPPSCVSSPTAPSDAAPVLQNDSSRHAKVALIRPAARIPESRHDRTRHSVQLVPRPPGRYHIHTIAYGGP